MTSQTEQQITTTHCLISNGNQKMKLGQLKEYKMRNIFLKNHTPIVVEKLV